ncbi:GPW/gp25 family protein [Moraxella pluranimalium]|uniref:Phage baseplate protein n=1 Tax=Moraxella pluranimalium TaxID=470453 RepID=A0A1T0CQM8_9GAMM|nr:GPW/gp25 family protein [Moraxella pluranimalium]OOS24646.1 phage baseplate protein [Moraxella pluranimalium]
MPINLTHAHWQIAPTGVSAIQGEDDLHQCVHNILSTRKGSDVLRPNFGSDHFDYIDYPHDVAIPNIVREIHVALTTWEKRIIVQRVSVTGLAPEFHCLIEWAVADDVARQIYKTEL